MHITNDIHEKLLVTLWAFLLITVFVLIGVCTHKDRPINDETTEVSQDMMVDEADDFEGEFLVPPIPEVSQSQEATPQHHLVQYNGRYFSYGKAFADRNDKHLNAAVHNGLNPGPENRAAAAKMCKELCEIHTNRYYVVEDLTHSLPYLVPIAANRLDSIGLEFADILARNDLPTYRFRVTSVLRSGEDIRRLQRCNSNSISNSPHNYGTTFDIGYARFDKLTQTCDSMTDDNLKLVLAQTLLNQQRAGHIYVKYEHKQGCFHITARN